MPPISMNVKVSENTGFNCRSMEYRILSSRSMTPTPSRFANAILVARPEEIPCGRSIPMLTRAHQDMNSHFEEMADRYDVISAELLKTGEELKRAVGILVELVHKFLEKPQDPRCESRFSGISCFDQSVTVF